MLGETAVGSAAFLFVGPLWGEVRRGFFKLTGAVIVLLALGSWRAAAGAAVPGDEAAVWAVRLAMALTIVTGLWVMLLFLRQHAPARVLGLGSVPLGAVMLVVLAGTGRQSLGVSLLQLVAGAAFLGAVTGGLLLGHWYLTDRKLSRAPIDRYSAAFIVAVGIEAIAVLSGGFDPVRSSRDINPLLTTGALAPWIALGMVATTGLIAALTKAALRGARPSAVQAATGFFYLAVVTAFTAEVAVKVRFLPG